MPEKEAALEIYIERLEFCKTLFPGMKNWQEQYISEVFQKIQKTRKILIMKLSRDRTRVGHKKLFVWNDVAFLTNLQIKA